MYIVIVNYNNSKDTIECLESVLKNTNNNYQIIVVDNSENNKSYDEIVNWSKNEISNIETKFHDIIYPLEKKPVDLVLLNEESILNENISSKILLVKAKENKGFSAANNIALKYILKFDKKNSLIWLLNNDTIIKKHTVDSILLEVSKFNDKDKIFFGTPLIDYNNPELIQATGGNYNYITGNSIIVDLNKPLLNYKFNPDLKVDFPIGASMLVTTNNLLSTGLLCEDYFLYFEELDWSFRMIKNNGYVKIINILSVYHKQGNSTNTKNVGKNSDFIDLVYLKAKMKFATKFNRYSLIVWVYTLTFAIFKRLLQGEFKRAVSIFNILIKKSY
ncbi:glycosyltransferase family 2 protein [Flavobacterium gelidilacus]|uniref:glycosyltransferase n=1 Tax=Flavobacterium gelidilacus TaxID=206041 RepID=UPI0003F77EBE|nr:glycosyltransferase family 2 protein [Flavobacterium gelidilacus]